MKSIFFLMAAAPFVTLAIVQTSTSANARSPEIFMAQNCPAGSIWDERKQRCVPRRPRGSHSDSNS